VTQKFLIALIAFVPLVLTYDVFYYIIVITFTVKLVKYKEYFLACCSYTNNIYICAIFKEQMSYPNWYLKIEQTIS